MDQASFSLTATINVPAQYTSDDNVAEASNAPAVKRQRADAEGSKLGAGESSGRINPSHQCAALIA